jgi:hypothetical protein
VRTGQTPTHTHTFFCFFSRTYLFPPCSAAFGNFTDLHPLYERNNIDELGVYTVIILVRRLVALRTHTTGVLVTTLLSSMPPQHSDAAHVTLIILSETPQPALFNHESP